MEPTILKRSNHNVSRKKISSATLKVLYRLKDEGYTAYLAGGGVRDLLLNRNPKDFDVVTDAILFRGEVIETSTFRAPVPEDETDFCDNTFRTTQGGMVMRDNIFGTPEQDALRRDFTINALFYNIADFSIIDYAGGLQDLDNKLIRVIPGCPLCGHPGLRN
jgi:poly(A) polymerase